ncbi:MAG: 50S ribosomal protein L4, partial [Neisseriaceae bacterium]|nr:50S ribosomal protein L4 [Neisseriaceae bacterium]
TPKTKEFFGKVQKMGLEGDILFLTRELDEKVYLSSRNLSNILVLETLEINPYSLLRFNKIVLTKDAVSHLEEQWV